MDLIVYVFWLALIGLVIGAVGRLIVPGPDPMGILGTIGIGLIGSFVAGLIAWALFGAGAGFLLSVIVTALLVYLVRRVRTRRPTRL